MFYAAAGRLNSVEVDRLRDASCDSNDEIRLETRGMSMPLTAFKVAGGSVRAIARTIR